MKQPTADTHNQFRHTTLLTPSRSRMKASQGSCAIGGSSSGSTSERLLMPSSAGDIAGSEADELLVVRVGICSTVYSYM